MHLSNVCSSQRDLNQIQTFVVFTRLNEIKAIVVAQLAEQSFLLPEVHGMNLVIGKLYIGLLSTVLKSRHD